MRLLLDDGGGSRAGTLRRLSEEMSKGLANVEAMSPVELFAMFGKVLRELRRRKIVRSSNNPIADYAEFLVKNALGLDLVSPATKGYDALDTQGRKYQIKARRLTAETKGRQLGIIRDFNGRRFDFLVGVLFDEDCSVRRACLMPHHVVREVATLKLNRYQNGVIVHLPDTLWEKDGVIDITDTVKAAVLGSERLPPDALAAP